MAEKSHWNRMFVLFTSNWIQLEGKVWQDSDESGGSGGSGKSGESGGLGKSGGSGESDKSGSGESGEWVWQLVGWLRSEDVGRPLAPKATSAHTVARSYSPGLPSWTFSNKKNRFELIKHYPGHLCLRSLI